jgi:hypothetical protein
MTVGEASNYIQDKIGQETQRSLFPPQSYRLIVSEWTDYGLFLPLTNKWINRSKTLEFYDLRTGDCLEFKKRFRPLRIKTMDDSVKTVI